MSERIGDGAFRQIAVVKKPEYVAKYPELYGGAYGIKPEILDHEVNKFSQCDNTHAREAYGWQPQVDIETGLSRVIEAETKMLAEKDKK